MDDSIEPSTRGQWREWLEAHHATSRGVWVVYPKKAYRAPEQPDYEAIVLEALCFGWIDSRPGTVDAQRTRLWLTPRKLGSGWAASNKRRLEHLEAAGLMHPAGQAVVARAKADGSWSLIDGSESTTEPDDLLAAFDGYPGSRDYWNAFPPGVRRQILQWIEQAKTAPTRERRIDTTASLAAQNIRANQWSPKSIT